MTEAMYDFLHIIAGVPAVIFKLALLYLIHKYIQVRRFKA